MVGWAMTILVSGKLWPLPTSERRFGCPAAASTTWFRSNAAASIGGTSHHREPPETSSVASASP
jgi:hypothetical protein